MGIGRMALSPSGGSFQSVTATCSGAGTTRFISLGTGICTLKRHRVAQGARSATLRTLSASTTIIAIFKIAGTSKRSGRTPSLRADAAFTDGPR